MPALDPYRETWRGKRTAVTTTETEHSFDELPSMTYCAGLEARIADEITKHPLHIDPIAALKRAGRHNDDTADLSVGIAAAAASSRNGGGKRPYPAPLSPFGIQPLRPAPPMLSAIQMLMLMLMTTLGGYEMIPLLARRENSRATRTGLTTFSAAMMLWTPLRATQRSKRLRAPTTILEPL
ncbi:MAG: hypothetical protein H6512_04155 [Acidimicrobiia bacterium]|nr:hypothetical protein [Acidimicrobiia bacterium]